MAKLRTLIKPAPAQLFDPHAGRHTVRRTSNTYGCGNISTQPLYIPPERLKAFTLPSRVGNRLYYPDGTVTEIDNHGRNQAHA
ncbi:hypothetical protein [Comamonas kerstersii]|uniref:hypothetical protein n=1 Tax=Comamonas kerstersii TaxID=225992 RepID=UPI001B33E850|nr:hypothetical protein [Comamonas kerstersii]QTW18210.1 hypothetical protein H8N02_13625 [Comamonas kerstersii]